MKLSTRTMRNRSACKGSMRPQNRACSKHSQLSVTSDHSCRCAFQRLLGANITPASDAEPSMLGGTHGTARVLHVVLSVRQEADSEKMKLAAALAEERARAAGLERKLHKRACEVVQLRQRAEELRPHRTASPGWQQQEVQLAAAADEQQSQPADSPAGRLPSCDQAQQTGEEGVGGWGADEASPPLRGAASCADSEHMATRVSAEAWTNALAAQIDGLQVGSSETFVNIHSSLSCYIAAPAGTVVWGELSNCNADEVPEA